MTIAEELTKLLSTKADIKAAISEKGVEVPSGTPFSHWCESVLQINGSSETFDYYTDDPSKTAVQNEMAELQNTKENLRKAIIACGVEVDEALPFSEYGNKIREIETGGEDPGQYGILYYMDGGTEKSLLLASEADFRALGNNGSSTSSITVNGQSIVKDKIVGYTFGSTVVAQLPASFLKSTSLKTLKGLENYSVSGISSSFLQDCKSFNQPISLPKTATYIYDSFMQGCSNFNQSVTIPDTVTTITSYFMRECTLFNQLLVLPSNLRTIGDYFLFDCTMFSQPIALPNTLTKIGDNFLAFVSSASSFNSSITYEGEALALGNGFLSGCAFFNQPLNWLEKVTSIGSYRYSNNTAFLYNCARFNQPLRFNPDLTEIPSMIGCQNFNSELILPTSPTSIGQSFMDGFSAFDQPLTVPDTVTSVGTSFMHDCANFIGPLNVGKSSGVTSNIYSLATSRATNPMYATGVTLIGENAQVWKDALPNADTGSQLRKLILG